MPRSLTSAVSASPREQLADVCATPAKAELRTQAGASTLRDLAAETIRTVSGNARAAAIDLQIHEAHLSRQLKDGSLTLARLEVLGPTFAAKFGQALVEQFGTALETPQARIRRMTREMRQRLDEIDQFLEHVS